MSSFAKIFRNSIKKRLCYFTTSTKVVNIETTHLKINKPPVIKFTVKINTL
jgi:hypothetical protein